MATKPWEQSKPGGTVRPNSQAKQPGQTAADPDRGSTKKTPGVVDASKALPSFYVNMDSAGQSFIDDGSKNFTSLLGAPALSNFYKVSINLRNTVSDPNKQLSAWVTASGVFGKSNNPTRFDFLCAETLIPGTALDAFSEVGSFQGIEEFFPGRRIYTDISLSFYVSADYFILKMFQEWINFINPISNASGMMRKPSPSGYESVQDSAFFHRYRYPNEYKTDISINKFEKNMNNSITYKFLNAFPVNISSLPLSYDSAQILKVTVDFKYDRYLITSHVDGGEALSGQFPPTSTDKSGSSQVANLYTNPVVPKVSGLTGSVTGTDYWNSLNTIDTAQYGAYFNAKGFGDTWSSVGKTVGGIQGS